MLLAMLAADVLQLCKKWIHLFHYFPRFRDSDDSRLKSIDHADFSLFHSSPHVCPPVALLYQIPANRSNKKTNSSAHTAVSVSIHFWWASQNFICCLILSTTAHILISSLLLEKPHFSQTWNIQPSFQCKFLWLTWCPTVQCMVEGRGGKHVRGLSRGPVAISQQLRRPLASYLWLITTHFSVFTIQGFCCHWRPVWSLSGKLSDSPNCLLAIINNTPAKPKLVLYHFHQTSHQSKLPCLLVPQTSVWRWQKCQTVSRSEDHVPN